MAPPTPAPRRQATHAIQPPQNGVQAARGMLQESGRVSRPHMPHEMHNAMTLVKEAISALQSEHVQELGYLRNDRDTIRTTLTAEIKTLEASLYDEKMRNKKVDEAHTEKVERLDAEIKTLTADQNISGADLYDEMVRNKKIEQDLKKSQKALKEERA
ncbi:hypothetical protein IG631_21226 [Alternaria alternata]|nr:hypothetical protein IG631_21226 [Alternaria alternata]